MRRRTFLTAAVLSVGLLLAGVDSRIVRAQTGGEVLRGLRERRLAAAQKAGAVQDTELGGRKVAIWEPTQAGAGPAPLVLFSHGFHGGGKQSVFLTQALAEAGYVVVAPTHADALDAPGGLGLKAEASFARPAEWSDATYRERANDLKAVLQALQKDEHWSRKIDFQRLALMGHSLGGYTVLGLAGAWPSWKLPGVKAVLALSPFCTPFTEKHTLGKLDVPVMYQGGTADFGITPSVKAPEGAYAQTPAPAYFIEFAGAGHFAWTELNKKYQPSVIEYGRAFLDRYVKGDRTADLQHQRADVAELRSK